MPSAGGANDGMDCDSSFPTGPSIFRIFHYAPRTRTATQPLAEIVNFITAYAEFVSPPIRCGINVIRLECRGNPGGFLAESPEGTVTAENVIVVTGPYQRPAQPSFLADEAGVFQIHANSYRNPDQLPAGAVLIVGSGASGAQIAEELVRAGRRVYLSIGRQRRLPRRYRGQDLIWWLTHMGLDRKAADQRGDCNSLPLISGAFGGNTIDFRQFAAMGVILLGRLISACGSALQFAPDLGKNLAFGDTSFAMFLNMVDVFIDSHNLDVPGDSVAGEIFPDPSCLTKPINRLDIVAEGVSTIISATGYRYDFGWIEAPVIGWTGKTRPSQRHNRSAGTLLSWSPIAVDVELLAVVGGRHIAAHG